MPSTILADPTTPPTLPVIGAALRSVVLHLHVVASHIVVCTKALEHQAADDDIDVVVVLRQTVGTSLFSQTSRLSRLASRCDGLPPDDEDMEEDDDSGRAP